MLRRGINDFCKLGTWDSHAFNRGVIDQYIEIAEIDPTFDPHENCLDFEAYKDAGKII